MIHTGRDADPGTFRCGSRPAFTFDAIGTRWSIETDTPLDTDLCRQLRRRIDDFDAVYSRFRPDSLISRIAAAPVGGRFTFPEDSCLLFELYDRLAVLTEGAVDPLVGRDLELLGYDRTYTLTPAPAPVRARHARVRPSWSTDVIRDGALLTTHRPLVIDVGAAGKGHLVDLVAALLRDAAISRFVVDAGGDLRHDGEETLRVGLEHPLDPTRVIGIAHLHQQALCASATNRRAWGTDLHHILDGRTGLPAGETLATWVIADDAAVADALATALFFTAPHQLATAYHFTYVRVGSDGRVDTSPDFVGELFG
ncbi:FAD:protein FMN transferase [Streptomyces scopuliridis]|uniref:FAD:protein FMN transferase n=1 Tax=Streptomyces scopuliridis RB72 TaxID=1440053 RepID=A0A2T7T9F9_9ACTN|nr:FAD:protein FMN transferase [Streptomyces scopuliridis]PVE11804.1 membrane-associated lipoprotein involved in thiamine biosynthesis [Streptomyces scopuliridis RB72]